MEAAVVIQFFGRLLCGRSCRVLREGYFLAHMGKIRPHCVFCGGPNGSKPSFL